MPHVDKRSGELVIRIVYDGAAEAGKTTNIAQLTSMIALQRRGAVESPGTSGSRTEFFDWLDFSGGFIDGKRVRCQLVSVPGQPELLHRRRYLLEAADAIVYVADARRDKVGESVKNLATTLRILEKLGSKVPVGVVVQANKQDLSDVLDPEALAGTLELPPTVPVVPSAAMTGNGVMETFILATRLATDRVRAMLYEEELPDFVLHHETPAALYQAMADLETAVIAEEEARRRAEEEARVRAEQEARRRAEEEARRRAEEEEARVRAEEEARRRAEQEARRAEEEARRRAEQEARRAEEERLRAEREARRNGCPPELLLAIGPGLEISAGHVWPPVKGRALLVNASLGSLQIPEFVVPWAPNGAKELRTVDGWTFHSTDRWLFEEEPRARMELLSLVRRQLEWGELLFESRALFLAAEGKKWRLWAMTGTTQTLRDALIGVLRELDIDALRRVWSAAVAFARRVETEGSAKIAGADALCFVGGKVFSLAIQENRPWQSDDSRDLLDELREVVREHAARDPRLSTWLERHEEMLGERRDHHRNLREHRRNPMALNVTLLRESFGVVASANPRFISRFYDILFERHPQARPLFTRNLRRQQEKMLTEALVAVLDHLEDAPWLRQTLGALGAKHVEYGVTPEMYGWVGESLLATLAEVAGPAWNDDLRAAWSAAYEAITSMMLEGTAQAS